MRKTENRTVFVVVVVFGVAAMAAVAIVGLPLFFLELDLICIKFALKKIVEEREKNRNSTRRKLGLGLIKKKKKKRDKFSGFIFFSQEKSDWPSSSETTALPIARGKKLGEKENAKWGFWETSEQHQRKRYVSLSVSF